LKADGEIDADFVSDAITSGNVWAIKNRYAGVFHGEDIDGSVVRKVHDIIGTWSQIEYAVSQLSSDEVQKLEGEAAAFGKDPRFPGFDGNNESEYMSAARFMIEKLGFYPEMGARAYRNSHMQTIQTFDRMKPVFDAEWKNGNYALLGVDSLIRVLNAQRHPDYR
jgi:uncharacterized protein YfbU (UPF0304 family)